MVSDALRELMIAAHGVGELEGEDVCYGAAGHPVCGDEVEVYLRLDSDRIAELRWRASGCPACVAVAAAAPVALVGCRSDQVAAALRRRLANLGGLERHEHHAERLLVTAVNEALQR